MYTTIKELTDPDRKRADKPIRWWTCFLGHHWTKWRPLWQHELARSSFDARSCIRCGKTVERWV